MRKLLQDLLESLKPQPAEGKAPDGGKDRQHALQLAAAVLLIEVVRADGEIEAAELEAVAAALRRKFALDPAEIEELVELARHRSEHTHDLYTFTERLNESLDEAARIRLFEMLWTVAYADGHADAHEAHLLRKVADLLHLRHAAAIGAKLRAEAAR